MKPNGYRLVFCLLLLTSPVALQARQAIVPKDTIVSVLNLNSRKDTVRINEVIAIKLNTKKPLSSFTTLYLGGIAVPKLKPWKTSEYERTVYFIMNSKVETLVDQFIQNESSDKTLLPVSVGIGTAGTCLAIAPESLNLEIKQRIDSKLVWVLVGVLVLITGVSLWKNILKDDNNLYYSLGRTQLFFWTIIFVVSYLYICQTTGMLPDIPGSLLTILGISIGTTAFSKVIENKNKDGVGIDPEAKSEGWFFDILSDGTSINIQRFQNVVFNLVFGVIFLQKVFSTKVIPTFDDNVLLLMGISSGTYAGLKMTEATKEQNAPPVPVGTDDPVPDPATPEETNPATTS